MSEENYLHILVLLPKLNLKTHEIVMSRFLRVNNPYKECKILIPRNLILLGTANVNEDNCYSNDIWEAIYSEISLAYVIGVVTSFGHGM